MAVIPNGPRSQPPLAAEDDLNPKRAKRGLRPAQPASKCAGAPWPARPGPSGHSIASNMRGRIEERAKNARSGELELPPKRSLRPALPFGNRCEHQQDSAVRKIGTSNDLLDPVENDGSGGGKQNFVLISEQPTGRKSTAARQSAEGVRQSGRQAAEIVEGQDVAIAGSDEQLPLIARQRPHRCHAGVDQRPQELGEDGLR
jgi:hypothetical protein